MAKDRLRTFNIQNDTFYIKDDAMFLLIPPKNLGRDLLKCGGSCGSRDGWVEYTEK